MVIPGIKNQEQYNKLLALLKNSLSQLKVAEFRQRFGIPSQGFPYPGEEYKSWVLQFSDNASLKTEFMNIAMRCTDMHAKVNPVFCAILAQYIVFETFPSSYPAAAHLPSCIPTIKPNGLGYIDVTITLPFFFTFEDVVQGISSNEGLARGFIENIQESTKMISEGKPYSPTAEEVDKAFMKTTPGNPADVVDRTQRDIEYLAEYGRVLLEESVSRMKTGKIEKYEDKNAHISIPIQHMGMWLSNRGMYNVCEIFWANITEETDIINSGRKEGEKLNRGISLGNTGVYQLAQGKLEEGLFNLYRAFEEDRSVLEMLQDPNSDPQKNLVSTILYRQFEEEIVEWLYNHVLSPHSSMIPIFPIKGELASILDSVEPMKRVQLFVILSNMRLALAQEKILSNPISRSHIIAAFSDIGIWVEDATRKKGFGYLFPTFQSNGLLKSYQLGTDSKDLDELNRKLEEAEKTLSIEDNNALTLVLIRNFSEHNFDSQEHNFFTYGEKYLARIFFSILFLRRRDIL